MNFHARAHLSEWMDQPCAYEEMRSCLRDLAKVNRFTFAYRPTLHWLQTLLRPDNAVAHIVDVGCGGGDTLRQIERWAERRRISVQLTGIDLNPFAARVAREFSPATSRITWVTGDAFSYKPSKPIDLVISSLFTHHLADAEIPRFIGWMEGVTTRGWFINDLHRERMPYYGFRALASVMRFHRFVRHDGPISIRRAFRHEDWNEYLREAGISSGQAQLTCFRPARLCVSRVKA